MNFISPVFICFRWWRRCEGGCFPELYRVSISTHFHPTMSFSLYKMPYLYIHPPAVLPFLHPCKPVPAASPGKAAQHAAEERRSKAPEGDQQCCSKVDPSGTTLKSKLCVSGKPNTMQLCTGSSTEPCVLLLEGYKQPEEAVWWEMCARDTKKWPEPECYCTVSPTEHPAHHNLLKFPLVFHKHPSLIQTFSHGPSEAAKWKRGRLLNGKESLSD